MSPRKRDGPLPAFLYHGVDGYDQTYAPTSAARASEPEVNASTAVPRTGTRSLACGCRCDWLMVPGNRRDVADAAGDEPKEES